jgi:hypothetical protein
MTRALSNPRSKRLRGLVKWGGLGASSLLLLVGGVSAWCSYSLLLSNDTLVRAECSAVWVLHLHNGVEPHSGWTLRDARDTKVLKWHDRPTFIMQPEFSIWDNGWKVSLPLWLPILSLAVPTVAAWRTRARPPSTCHSCRYDLIGNTMGVCPECGNECKGA